MKTFFCILFFFFSINVYAAPLKSTYKAEGLGMTVLKADMQIDLSENEYTIQTHSYTQGILSLFISPETIFKTRGKIHNQKLEVVESVMQNKSGKKIETVRANFADKPNYIDYQSVLIALMQLPNATENIFYLSDGKRDMRVTLTNAGTIDLSTIYPSLSGTAEEYSVQIDVIAGKKKGWFFKHMKETRPSPLKLYLKQEGTQKKLILGTFDTGILGKLYIMSGD